MYETIVTMVGWVAGEVTRRRRGDGTTWARFRLAAVERRFDSDKADWVDANRMFVSVHCWRKLGDNVLATLKRGDPVVVHGRLRLYEHDSDQQSRFDLQVDAYSLGVDLSRRAVIDDEAPTARPELASVA